MRDFFLGMVFMDWISSKLSNGSTYKPTKEKKITKEDLYKTIIRTVGISGCEKFIEKRKDIILAKLEKYKQKWKIDWKYRDVIVKEIVDEIHEQEFREYSSQYSPEDVALLTAGDYHEYMTSWLVYGFLFPRLKKSEKIHLNFLGIQYHFDYWYDTKKLSMNIRKRTEEFIEVVDSIQLKWNLFEMKNTNGKIYNYQDPQKLKHALSCAGQKKKIQRRARWKRLRKPKIDEKMLFEKGFLSSIMAKIPKIELNTSNYTLWLFVSEKEALEEKLKKLLAELSLAYSQIQGRIEKKETELLKILKKRLI